ncbi:MAG: hypothetical protein WD768_02305 [Phycisphaeraceae bacterium]
MSEKTITVKDIADRRRIAEAKLFELEQKVRATQIEINVLLELEGHVAGQRESSDPADNKSTGKKVPTARMIRTLIRNNPGKLDRAAVALELESKIQSKSTAKRRIILNTISNMIKRGRLREDDGKLVIQVKKA